MRKLFKMIGTLATTMFIAGGATAAFAATAGEKFGNWTVGCEANGQVCHIGQKIVTQQDNRTLLEVGVGMMQQPDGSKAPKMIILAPLGILLPQNLVLQVDQSEPVRLPFLQCLPNGCRTVINLEAEGLQKLKAGSEAKFTYFLPNGQPITVPISLQGFTAGFSAVAQ